MAVACVRTAWAGTSGGPGVTQLYMYDTVSFGQLTAAQAQNAVNSVRAFWNSLAALLPNEITLTTSTVVDQYDTVTGDLLYSTTAAAQPATVVGTDVNAYAMASGIKTQLQTGVIRNGRRVRGAIFIVPAAITAFSALGTVGTTPRNTINTAGTSLISALATTNLALIVFSRPIPAGKPGGPRSGDAAQVTAFDTSEKGAVLRGRRD